MLLRCAFLSTVSIVSANSFTKTGPPWLRYHRCVSARQGNPTTILETESITFFDGDSSFITASNSERHGFFLCVSGGDESYLKDKEGSSEGDADASDDDDDDDDDSGDDGANKMLSTTSVRLCRIATVQCKNTMACTASSSIHVAGSQPVADGAKKNNHLAIPPERCRKQRVPTFPSVTEPMLTTRGGESTAAPSSATIDNEFSRRLVVAALVTLLYEAIIGHLLEFLKIVMQTSPPGTSYTQVGRYFYFQLTPSAVSEFSFSSFFFKSFPSGFWQNHWWNKRSCRHL